MVTLNLNLLWKSSLPESNRLLWPVLRRMISRRSRLPGTFLSYLVTLSSIDSMLLTIFLADRKALSLHRSAANLTTRCSLVWGSGLAGAGLLVWLLHPAREIAVSLAVLWLLVLAAERYLAVTQVPRNTH